QPLVTLKSSLGVSSLHFSPDGQFLATAGPAGIPRLWETASGRPVTTFAESDHGFPISASVQLSKAAARLVSEVEAHPVSVLAFSPEGEWLATGNSEGLVRVWAVATGKVVTEFNQGEAVTTLAFGPATGSVSPGQLLAVGSGSGNLRIWQMTAELALAQTSGTAFPFQLKPKLTQVVSVLAHKDVILGLTFSPDGRRLVSASADHTARLWNVAVMLNPKLKFAPSPVEQPPWELTRLEHGGAVRAITYSPDGRWLATASVDHTVRLWDVSMEVNTGRELAHLPQPSLVKDLLFSPNGRWLATASDDNTVRVWATRVLTQSPQIEIRLPAAINGLTFSPDSLWLATAGDDGTARVWEMATGREISRLSHSAEVTAVAFSPDPDRPWVATASRDGITRLWQIETARFSQSEAVLGLNVSRRDPFIAAQSYDQVRVWDISNNHMINQESQAAGINSTAISPDGRWLATAGDDGTARLWDIASGNQVAQLPHPKAVQMVAFDPDSSHLATVSGDDVVRLWNMAVLTKTRPLTAPRMLGIAHTSTINAIDFSADGQLLALGGADGVVWVSNVRSARPVLRLTHPESVLDVAFSPPSPDSTSSQWLVTASADQTARVWEVDTGQEVARLKHEGAVEEVLFSPDGGQLATRTGRLVQVWDMAKVLNPIMVDRPVARLRHPEPVRNMVFSPACPDFVPKCEQWLATVSGSPTGIGTMQVWQVASGQKLLELNSDYKINRVIFSPDRRFLWTGSADGQVRLWWWQPEDLIAQSCFRLTRNLTRQEWQQYLGDLPYQPTCPNLPAGE
ncbi:MAG: WD40 repeat domain-containing protein, partial [Anaerolineae bacterium]